MSDTVLPNASEKTGPEAVRPSFTSQAWAGTGLTRGPAANEEFDWRFENGVSGWRGGGRSK